MLLAAAERRIGIAQRLAGLIADPRNPLLVTHSVVDILRARMLAIACGYEDARSRSPAQRSRTGPWRANAHFHASDRTLSQRSLRKCIELI
jgi:Transposase DDE domain group 1